MSISSQTRRAARLLKRSGRKVVFAESCTGGLVSGALTAIAGISHNHCGGMVVYRNETKRAWLAIPPAVLESPGPVSVEVTELLARRVLEKTPEADVAVAVTGHLGPLAPPALDGRAFAAVVCRGRGGPAGNEVCETRHIDCREYASRRLRQRHVIEQVLGFLGDVLEASSLPAGN